MFLDGYTIHANLIDRYDPNVLVNVTIREVNLTADVHVTMALLDAVELLRDVYLSISMYDVSRPIAELGDVQVIPRCVTFFQIVLPDGGMYTYVPYGVTINE